MFSSDKAKSLKYAGNWSMCFKIKGNRFSPIAALTLYPCLCAAAWSVFIFAVASRSPER